MLVRMLCVVMLLVSTFGVVVVGCFVDVGVCYVDRGVDVVVSYVVDRVVVGGVVAVSDVGDVDGFLLLILLLLLLMVVIM